VDSACEFLTVDGAEACSTLSGFATAGVGATAGVLAAADSDFFTASAAGFFAVAGCGFFALSASGLFVSPVTVMETTWSFCTTANP